MATLTDLVADSRGFEGPVVEIAGRKTPYTYDDFAPNVWKSGNLFGHYGVHPGADVTVVAGPKHGPDATDIGRIDAADPLFAMLGATLLGGTVRLVPVEPVDARALVVPSAWVDRYGTEPGCSVIAYGEQPDDPSVVHFETEMWSENPTEPPESVAVDDPAIRTSEGVYSHGELLGVATDIESEFGLEAGDSVVLEAALTGPGAFVAGVLTTISAGGTLVLAGDRSSHDAKLVVTEGRDEREKTIGAGAVTERLRDTRRA